MIRPIFLNTVLLGGTPEEKLIAAHDAGFDQVELWTNDIDGFPGGASAVRRFAASRGLGITDYQVLLDFDGAPGERRAAKRAEAEHILDTAVTLGASTILAPASTDPECDHARIVDDLAWLVDHARMRGLRVAYEGMASSTVNHSISRAWQAICNLDRRHAGIVVDAYHLFVTGGRASDLDGIDPDRIFLVQLSDVATPVAPTEYKNVARHSRLLPGEGRLPLASLIVRLDGMRYRGPIGLEVFNDELKASPPAIVAAKAFSTLHAALR
jgi:4-hydroxyphenylpyruvate dioxygenase